VSRALGILSIATFHPRSSVWPTDEQAHHQARASRGRLRDWPRAAAASGPRSLPRADMMEARRCFRCGRRTRCSLLITLYAEDRRRAEAISARALVTNFYPHRPDDSFGLIGKLEEHSNYQELRLRKRPSELRSTSQPLLPDFESMLEPGFELLQRGTHPHSFQLGKTDPRKRPLPESSRDSAFPVVSILS